MPPDNISQPTVFLPPDRRARQGGYLFLASLVMFFISSLILYGMFAYWRRDDPQTLAPLPESFLVSTACLLVISVLVHAATRTIRREKRWWTSVLLLCGAAAALSFVSVQIHSMNSLLGGPAIQAGAGKGVAGMVIVLVILHALHVAGGIVAMGLVALGSLLGRYDHERHWPVDFTALYWHFLDLVWLAMLSAFWLTTGGFDRF